MPGLSVYVMIFNNMDYINQQIDYWKKSAERNWKTAGDLFQTKHYDACLFFCHLALEKALKGLAVQETKKPAPYIHDLEKLADLAKIDLDQEQIQNMRTISTFNIAARYDDIKLAFYKKCTKEFTSKHLLIAKDLYLWLKNKSRKA